MKILTSILALFAILPISPTVVAILALFASNADAASIYDRCNKLVRKNVSGYHEERLIRERVKMCWYAFKLKEQRMRGYGGDPNILRKRPPVHINGKHWDDIAEIQKVE